MSVREEVRGVILRQIEAFSAAKIGGMTGASPAVVNGVLNELIDSGVLELQRVGRRYIYTIKQVSVAIHERLPGGAPQKLYTDPAYTVAERFECIRNVVRMVVDKVNPSALIVGRPGVGKTFLVRDELIKANLNEGEDYVFISGHTSALGLYKALYNNNDKLVVLDDCDSAFSDAKSINILKAALDSYDIRRISWISERTSNKDDIEPDFDFTGQVIFISNLYSNQIDSAICSRAFCMDLYMTDDEVTEHMKNLLPALEPHTPLQEKQEVLDFICTIPQCFTSYGIRTLIQAIRIRKASSSSLDWKKRIRIIACKR